MAAAFVPGADVHDPDLDSTLAVKLIALGALAVSTAINCAGTRMGAWVTFPMGNGDESGLVILLDDGPLSTAPTLLARRYRCLKLSFSLSFHLPPVSPLQPRFSSSFRVYPFVGLLSNS